MIASSLLGLPYDDLSGGFKLWRATCLADLDLDGLLAAGYAFQIETTQLAHLARQAHRGGPLHLPASASPASRRCRCRSRWRGSASPGLPARRAAAWLPESGRRRETRQAGIRTSDFVLRRDALYPLSYSRGYRHRSGLGQRQLDLDAAKPIMLRSKALEDRRRRCHRASGMDATDDPLTRLASELERLSQAHLALSEATASLIPQAAPHERRILGQAAAASRAAARTAAEASARTLAATDA